MDKGMGWLDDDGNAVVVAVAELVEWASELAEWGPSVASIGERDQRKK
jgi:hypothetical protein